MTAAIVLRQRRSRSLYIVSLIFAAFLGFIASPLLTGYSDCRIKLPKREFVSASPPVIALRLAAREEAESDTPAIARWIDDNAILLLEIGVAIVAFLAFLLILAMAFTPYKPIEPEHLADGDTGPWPQLQFPEDRR
jgi:hypothetical protein